MNTTASVNANKTEMHSDYQSVNKQTKGENAGAQSLGAMTAEAVGLLSKELYGKDPSKLTEDEKATVSAFASLAAGIAGGLVGGDTSSAANAAEAGKATVENNALSGEDAQKKKGLELALSSTGQMLHPRTPEEISELKEQLAQINQLDAEVDKYIQDACSQGKASSACREASALAQSLQQSYGDSLGKMTYKELNPQEYAKVSQIIANTSADKWDIAIDNYAKAQNISYQEAKDTFAIAINMNQTADVVGIFYGLKGANNGKPTLNMSTSQTLKQVLSKYGEFKQNIANTTKGHNDNLVPAGAGHNGSLSVNNSGKDSLPNAHLSTGSGSQVSAINPNTKIATGQSVGEFEKNLSKLPPRERVAVVKESAPKIAAEHGMIKDNQLTKRNGRDVYRGQDGYFYALDTQHGRFEVVSSKGKHLGEVDFAMQKIPNSIDKSGGHNLKVK
ncbi:putative heme utilization/adhesion exoprotein [Moellerella wisconsensis ATCC 35017]|uniref:Putative heme utilization/adhesion exoprotein n=1 Tax=Moellerella wisconsensis ATCC 35017 TaxID=1354267 RepID=A0A0N1KIE5_9GAMM|nr:putative heme utilization/adhesion exoprotein [Moellerella wisconsensis ATCC 35017]